MSAAAEYPWTPPDTGTDVKAELRPSFEIEQRQRQSERLEAVGRLAGGVAHDFNNVLTGILLYCDLLLASFDSGQGIRKYAEEIRSAGIQATGLVRQLLAVSRARTSDPGLLSLNEIIGGMRSLLARLIGEHIALKFQLDPDLGLVKMDPTQAQQILLNLVLNARDAMPGGGEITIETSNCRVQILGESRVGSHSVSVIPPSLPCALFVVGDNGTGMQPETRAHLFEAFYTTKSDGRGTGLGLATVHEIVTSNGGLIHVASAPDCGARVSVLLPLVPEEISKSQSANDAQPETHEGALPDSKRNKTP
jgi:two-component system, cell cycle sensor histidine kinase and response regulator CckA